VVSYLNKVRKKTGFLWMVLTCKYYLPTVRASLIIWPAASTAVFYVIPMDLIVPFNACVNLIWTIILGLIA
jgi:hypothetical protein